MINDAQMLNYISETADMGRDSLMQTMQKAEDPQLRTVMMNQSNEYEKKFAEASNMLQQFGETPKKANPVAKMSAHTTSNVKTFMSADTTSKIAEMVIEGSTMGITKMTKHLNDYSGNNQQIKTMAQDLIKAEQTNIDQMKQFL